MKPLACLSLLPFLFSSAFAQTPTIDQMVALKHASSPAIAPDGKSVAYVLHEPVWEDNDFLSHVWLATEDGQRHQLTRGKKSCWAPHFSPEGKRLAFLSDRAG